TATTSASISRSDRWEWRSHPPTTPGKTSPRAPATASSSPRTVADSGSRPRSAPSGRPAPHLRIPPADAMLFDFSDSEWPFGLDGAIQMANAYPRTPLLLYHWGSVDAPDFPPFNADPDALPGRVENPERVCVLGPGGPCV